MTGFFQAIPFSFAALFPVVNPIGSAVIILSLVEGMPADELNRLASKIALYSAILLIVSLVAGSWILRLFGITIPIVLVGGGLVLAWIGWQMLNEKPTPKNNPSTQDTASQDIHTLAFYPLTMPITAGPGCIAVAIALGAHSVSPTWEQTLINQAGDITGILCAALTIWFCYRYAHTITERMGEAGTAVIMRLAAFFNLCIGIELIYKGIYSLWPL